MIKPTREREMNKDEVLNYDSAVQNKMQKYTSRRRRKRERRVRQNERDTIMETLPYESCVT
jgi:hypothetical protein